VHSEEEIEDYYKTYTVFVAYMEETPKQVRESESCERFFGRSGLYRTSTIAATPLRYARNAKHLRPNPPQRNREFTTDSIYVALGGRYPSGLQRNWS